jgi:hypothetical protein
MALYGVLDAVKARLGLFGVDSVDVISYIIMGYQNAISEHQISDDDLEHFNAGFLSWMRESFPNCPTHASWQSLIYCIVLLDWSPLKYSSHCLTSIVSIQGEN